MLELCRISFELTEPAGCVRVLEMLDTPVSWVFKGLSVTVSVSYRRLLSSVIFDLTSVSA